MKVHKSTAGLVALLQSRGLAFNDPAAAVQTLRSVNYYRFTGYSRYFQVDPRGGNDTYVAGASFDVIIRLMQLDDEMRVRLFVALSEVEMSVRTRFAHVAGRLYGNEGFYIKKENYLSDSAETLKKIARIRDDLKESKQATVAHYRQGEDVSKVPVWVAVEQLSFGKISWMLGSLDNIKVYTEVATHFGYDIATFPRAVQSLADLRNLCAHHGQLWHRNLVSQCPLQLNKRDRPTHITYHAQSLYPAVVALHKLATSPSARGHLAAIERRLAAGGVHADGILNPSGIR